LNFVAERKQPALNHLLLLLLLLLQLRTTMWVFLGAKPVP
jgi:hypothetical protein